MNNSILPEKKIVWLASYPKSGNTWFRAFLTALLNEGELDINEMKTDGIYSSRQIFDAHTDLNSMDFYDEEIKILQPEVFAYLTTIYQKEHLFVKIHDAYTFNKEAMPIVPTEATRCAVYFIRNPLDVAASLANHNGSTIDQAIEVLNDPMNVLSHRGNFNVNNQFNQLVYSWSGHVESWTGDLPFPVLVLRYEDMLADTLATFTRAVNFMGVDKSSGEIQEAILAAKFEELQRKESENGFREKPIKNETFFRKGQAGGWKNELNDQQIETILNKHKMTMELFNYYAK